MKPVKTLTIVAMLLLVIVSCDRQTQAPNWSRTYGDPVKGAAVIEEAGCGQCHRITGIPDASGRIGPPLIHFAIRTTIAGVLPNTPENLMHWIWHPQAVRPGDVMPDMGLSEQQARDAAAYLQSLR